MCDEIKEKIKTDKDTFFDVKEKFLDSLVEDIDTEVPCPEIVFGSIENTKKRSELKKAFRQAKNEMYYKFWHYNILPVLKEDEFIEIIGEIFDEEEFYSSIQTE